MRFHLKRDATEAWAAGEPVFDLPPCWFHGARRPLTPDSNGYVHVGSPRAAAERLAGTAAVRGEGGTVYRVTIDSSVFGDDAQEGNILSEEMLAWEAEAQGAEGQKGFLYYNEVEDPGSVSAYVPVAAIITTKEPTK